MSVSTTVNEITEMLEMLPQEEQALACELIRRLIRAWDPDFTKLTPKEAAELKIAHEQVANGEVYSDDEIDWGNVSVVPHP